MRLSCASNDQEVSMRRTLAFWALGFAWAVVGVSGCKRHATPAPAQPVVRTLPPRKTEPDFPVGSLPPVNLDRDASAAVRQRPRLRQAQPMEAPPQPETQAPLEEEQRRQDATLLQQQQAASQRQQDELNRQIEQSVKEQQRIQAEPRILELPEVPISQPTQEPQI